MTLLLLKGDFPAGDEDSWAQWGGDEVGELAVVSEFVDCEVGLLTWFQ